ncbi:sensor histidine kinase [Microbacterium sp. B35-30]|uniref:sensor histidine kinase n=1 Tax=Microbacterium sp. B35-30 TaxID=1962642 RepID=UPI00195415AA|nr:sensor histidine kinase [Microbacterium sp. B35-30]
MIAIPQSSKLEERHNRIERMLAVAPYVLLLVPTVVTTVLGAEWPDGLITLGVAAVAVLWLWLMATRREPGVIFFVGLLVLIAILGWRNPWFAGLFGFTGYLYAWTVLRGAWRYVGVTLTAMINVAALMGDVLGTPLQFAAYVSFVVLTVPLVVLFSMLGDVTAERSAAYQQTVTQLQDVIAENAELHERLVAQAREAGIREERQRMAREIHDTLAQGFAGIATQLQAAQRAGIAGDDLAWRHHLDHAIRLTRDGLEEARRSVRAIGPAQLDATLLPDAVAAIAAEWSDRNGVRATVSVTGDTRPLHPEVEATVVRIAQEALSNSAKHADASRVGVTLSYMDDQVALDIRDDGVGFDAAQNSGDGRFGLTSMRQRVARLGGDLEVESSIGSGTAISATLPAIGARTSEEGSHA